MYLQSVQRRQLSKCLVFNARYLVVIEGESLETVQFRKSRLCDGVKLIVGQVTATQTK